MIFRIRRRCASPKTTTWSKHSRRIDPINRSAKPFCQGEAGAVGLSRIPIAQSAHDDGPVESIPIANEVLWGIIPRKCLCYLTRNPFCGRVCCNVEPDEVST